MSNFGKIMIAVFISAFWLFLPLGMQLFEVEGYDFQANLEKEDVDFQLADCTHAPSGKKDTICSVLNFFNWAGDILKAITLYIKMMFFNIPSAIGVSRYFLNFLQFVSVIFIVVMFRGN